MMAQPAANGGRSSAINDRANAGEARLDQLEGWRTAINPSVDGLLPFRQDTTGRLDHLENWRNTTRPALDGLAEFRDAANGRIARMEDYRLRDTVNFAAFRNDTQRRMEAFENEHGAADGRLNILENYREAGEGRHAEYDAWKESVDRWKAEKDARSRDFDTWRGDTINWMTGSDLKFEGLEKQKLHVEDYRKERGIWMSRLGAVEDGVASYSNAFDRVNSRLDDHDKKILDLNSKMNSVEGDIKKVGDEVKSCKKALNDRMDKSDKSNGSRFDGLASLITGMNKGPQPSDPAPGGGNGGGSKEPFGNGNNNNSGRWRGFNVGTNGGDFIHARDCHFGDNICGTCNCVRGIPLDPYGQRGISPPVLPPPYSLPSEYYPHGLRRKSHPGGAGSSSNWNHTPDITLGLSRVSPGGIFSKPQREKLLISMGSGGGGGSTGRRRRGKSDRDSSGEDFTW